MNVLGLIPARGGSKAIPRKNLALLGGRPLIAWTTEAGRESKRLSRLIVSTDDDEIAEVARTLGAEVPFRRSPELSDDQAPALAVIRHAVTILDDKENWRCDVVVYLQPTSPFRTFRHIDAAVDLLSTGACDVAVSVVAVPHNFAPGSLMRVIDGYLKPLMASEKDVLRRQDKPTLFARNGPAVLALTREAADAQSLYQGRVKPLPMSRLESIDIDDPLDLEIAEALLPLLGRHASGR